MKPFTVVGKLKETLSLCCQVIPRACTIELHRYLFYGETYGSILWCSTPYFFLFLRKKKKVCLVLSYRPQIVRGSTLRPEAKNKWKGTLTLILKGEVSVLSG